MWQPRRFRGWGIRGDSLDTTWSARLGLPSPRQGHVSPCTVQKAWSAIPAFQCLFLFMRPLNFNFTGPFTFHLILRSRLVDFMAVAWQGSWQVTPQVTLHLIQQEINKQINKSSPMEGCHGYWCRDSSCHGPCLLWPAHLIVITETKAWR
jgi:hypothetical protein